MSHPFHWWGHFNILSVAPEGLAMFERIIWRKRSRGLCVHAGFARQRRVLSSPSLQADSDKPGFFHQHQ
jgi:hypothetical protein